MEFTKAVRRMKFSAAEYFVISIENKPFFMAFRAISAVFFLFLIISCQSPQPEVKEVLHDTTVKIADSTSIVSDTVDLGSAAGSTPEGPDSNFIRKKLVKGIDFFAAGNEPFWSLDMDFEKQFTFTAIGGFTLVTSAVAESKSKKKNIHLYRSQTEAGEMLITLLEKECINSMSGAKSTYQVSVRVKATNDKDFIDYNGCGRYTVIK